MDIVPTKNYKELAKSLRREVLKMTFRAQSSHIGSNLSSADLLTVLYDVADFTPTTDGMTKDVVVVKSWNAANVFACLVRRELLPQEAIDRYGEEGTPWTTILEPITYNGLKVIPAATGAMGYHLPFAVGFALAKKVKKEEGTIYCLISDGELDVGSTWEALALAKHHKLDNLVLIIDRNGLQAMGETKDILDMEPVDGKLMSFGWFVKTIDGHNHDEILEALKLRVGDRPVAVVAKTIKGKGISFMEGENVWHYSHVNEETLGRALKELQ